jgi:hypothetical protein
MFDAGEFAGLDSARNHTPDVFRDDLSFLQNDLGKKVGIGYLANVLLIELSPVPILSTSVPN